MIKLMYEKSLNELNLFGTTAGTPLLTLWNHGHGEKRSYDTIKSSVVLLYEHLILLKLMKSLHESKEKSTTVLNISPLQIVPVSLADS